MTLGDDTTHLPHTVRKYLRRRSLLQGMELLAPKLAGGHSLPCSTPSLKLRRAQVLPHFVRERHDIAVAR